MLYYYYYIQDPRVIDAMMPYTVSFYGNPHSRTHAYGWESEQAVEKARKVNLGLSDHSISIICKICEKYKILIFIL